MIIEKMLGVIATSAISGGLFAEVMRSTDGLSTGLLGICVTILLFVVKELMGIKDRLSKLEQKVEDKL